MKKSMHGTWIAAGKRVLCYRRLKYFFLVSKQQEEWGEGGRQGFQPTHTINNTGPLQHSQQIQHDSLLFLLVIIHELHRLMGQPFLFFSKKNTLCYILYNDLISNGSYVKNSVKVL